MIENENKFCQIQQKHVLLYYLKYVMSELKKTYI